MRFSRRYMLTCLQPAGPTRTHVVHAQSLASARALFVKSFLIEFIVLQRIAQRTKQNTHTRTCILATTHRATSAAYSDEQGAKRKAIQRVLWRSGRLPPSVVDRSHQPSGGKSLRLTAGCVLAIARILKFRVFACVRWAIQSDAFRF